MLICTKCGQQNEGGATFCAKCSAFLEWTGERVEERPTPGPVIPQAVPATHGTHPSALRVPPDRLVLTTLSNSVQTVDPGNQAVFTLEVRNLGPTVDRLTIEVLGDAAAWAEVEPPALNLMPGTSGTTTVRLRPPRSSAMRAGDVSFGVGIRSAEHPGASVVERGVISITPFTELEVELAPRVTHGRRGGSVTLRATNAGNVPLSLTLAGGDPENALGFRFTPSTLHVEPGATALASVAVSAGGPFLFGSRRSRPFQVVASPANQPRRTLEGTFQQTALLPLWIPAGLVLGAAALGLFVLANPLGGKPPAIATPTQVPVTAAPPTQESPSRETPSQETPSQETPKPPPAAWWQEAYDAAAAKGIDLGSPLAEGTSDENLRYQEFSNGAIFERTNRAYALSDAIWRKWKTLGGGASAPQTLGYPASPVLGPDLDHRHQQFDSGAIYWTAQTDAHLVSGKVWEYWKKLVGQNGGDVGHPTEPGLVEPYGYPTSDMEGNGSDEWIALEHGRIGVTQDGCEWACLDGEFCLLCVKILPVQPILPTPAP